MALVFYLTVMSFKKRCLPSMTVTAQKTDGTQQFRWQAITFLHILCKIVHGAIATVDLNFLLLNAV